jgi:hypothetical protein
MFNPLLGEICTAISISMASSLNSFVWQIITYLWPWNWMWIVLFISGWIIWEIKTRYGAAHYNSKNGFSPVFNAFVGSGIYAGFQLIFVLFMTNVVGGLAYCNIWPFGVHIVLYKLSGWFLNIIGFWVYRKEPGREKYKRKRKW